MSLALGLSLGLSEIAVPIDAQHWHVIHYVGLLSGAFACGGVAAGFWFGRRRWQRGPVQRYLIAALVFGLIEALLAVAPDPAVLAVLLFISGGAFAPATISLFETLDVVAPGAGVQAFTWITSAEASGIAAGGAVGGGDRDARWALGAIRARRGGADSFSGARTPRVRRSQVVG